MGRHGRLKWLNVVVVPLVGLTLGGLVTGCAALEAPTRREPLAAATEPEELSPEPEEKEARVEVKMPALPKNASCQFARSAYREAWAIEGSQRADLTNGQFGSVLARHHYFEACKVPARYAISICAAVQNGEVLGATVRTTPRAPLYERCIDKGVRGLSFPVSPRMDVTNTVFAAKR